MLRLCMCIGCVMGGVLFFGGCAASPCEVKAKSLTEKEIAEQELVAEQARLKYFSGDYEEAAALLEPLCLERSSNLPLYQSELGLCQLACNRKDQAKTYLLDAYTSIEDFFDPASEKKAVSLWGSESEKVFKGDPYEQATLSLFTGLLLLEAGDIDNALACFKNGQVADSDVLQEQYKSDYALLQLLEAKCYQMRDEHDKYDAYMTYALESFTGTHPLFLSQMTPLEAAAPVPPAETPPADTQTAEHQALKETIRSQYEDYYAPLWKPYNTLLLVWSGRSPEMARGGRYGEKRMLIKNPSPEFHFELQVNGSEWRDIIYGYANISFQATTRGGRMMDDVLASHAAFKQTTEQVGGTMYDLANNTSDPYAKLAFLAVGLVASGISHSADASADIRCLKTLPDQIGIVPLLLPPGEHTVSVACYDRNFRHTRTVTQSVYIEAKPFQFHNIVISDPSMEKAKTEDIAINP